LPIVVASASARLARWLPALLLGSAALLRLMGGEGGLGGRLLRLVRSHRRLLLLLLRTLIRLRKRGSLLLRSGSLLLRLDSLAHRHAALHRVADG